jgi:hypothetical protein
MKKENVENRNKMRKKRRKSIDEKTTKNNK